MEWIKIVSIVYRGIKPLPRHVTHDCVVGYPTYHIHHYARGTPEEIFHQDFIKENA